MLVEKPAFPALADYEAAVEARDRAKRVVLVGENDHYKPLAVCLRRLIAGGAIGEMVFANFTTIAFFEEGIHWLHLAGSLGPAITSIEGFRPAPAGRGSGAQGDSRVKSMMVAFRYDNGAVGALFYSREIPSFFRGLRTSKLFGRSGVITFESNGGVVVVRSRRLPRVIFPGFRDIRGYQAMYRDFVGAIREGRAPEMSLERAIDDQRLMELAYANSDRS